MARDFWVFSGERYAILTPTGWVRSGAALEHELRNMTTKKSPRMTIYAIVVFSAAFAIKTASAAPCVKIRNGEGFACMKFSASEIKNAAKYGLRLTAPFKIVKKKLLKQGWQLDREYLGAGSLDPQSNQAMICGSGWDAICSTAFKRGDEVLYLKMSGTNDGAPLIDVGAED